MGRENSGLASEDNLLTFTKAEQLSFQAAKEIRELIEPGWTEVQAADLLNGWLKDHGVRNFFHKAYVWFGERTRFTGIARKNYWGYMPSQRVLRPGEAMILDVAPIYEGSICDIGFSDYDRSLGLMQTTTKPLVFWILSTTPYRGGLRAVLSFRKFGTSLIRRSIAQVTPIFILSIPSPSLVTGCTAVL